MIAMTASAASSLEDWWALPRPRTARSGALRIRRAKRLKRDPAPGRHREGRAKREISRRRLGKLHAAGSPAGGRRKAADGSHLARSPPATAQTAGEPACRLPQRPVRREIAGKGVVKSLGLGPKPSTALVKGLGPGPKQSAALVKGSGPGPERSAALVKGPGPRPRPLAAVVKSSGPGPKQ